MELVTGLIVPAVMSTEPRGTKARETRAASAVLGFRVRQNKNSLLSRRTINNVQGQLVVLEIGDDLLCVAELGDHPDGCQADQHPARRTLFRTERFSDVLACSLAIG